LPLGAAVPYGRAVLERAAPFGPAGAGVAAADVAADIVGMWSLGRGGLRYGSPVL
jgi:hypothetical protein